MDSSIDIVLAFDPGPHCGMALFMNHKWVAAEVIDDTAGKPSQYRRIETLLRGVIQPAANVTVVIEDFRSHRPLLEDGADTLKLAGWIQGTAFAQGYKVVWQMPMQRTPFSIDATLLIKDKRDETHGALPHLVDATAHALAYIARRGN